MLYFICGCTYVADTVQATSMSRVCPKVIILLLLWISSSCTLSPSQMTEHFTTSLREIPDTLQGKLISHLNL